MVLEMSLTDDTGSRCVDRAGVPSWRAANRRPKVCGRYREAMTAKREQVAPAAPVPEVAAAIIGSTPALSGPGLIAYLARAPVEERAAAIGDMHSRVGNRRVALTIRGGLAVQRAPKAFGLMTPSQVGGFAAVALAYWRGNPTTTLGDFGIHLLGELNKQLAANGVPPLPAPKLDSLRSAGGFAASSWTVQFNLAGTAQQPLSAKIGGIPADRISEVAGIFYHECRHAEQAFLVARLVASEAKGSKTAKQIAAELDLHEPAADAALKATGPLPGGKDGLATIKGWRAFEKGGEHYDYWDWNENLQKFVANTIKGLADPAPEGADGIRAEMAKLAPTLADWRKTTVAFADTKLATLKADKGRDGTDNQAMRDLTKTRAALKKVMDAEAKTLKQLGRLDARQKQSKKMSVDEAQLFQLEIAEPWFGLRAALAELVVVTGKGYEAYPHEADAYTAQRAVMKDFTARQKKP